MKEVKNLERRYFVELEEFAEKLGLEGRVTYVFWDTLNPGVPPSIKVTTTELVSNDFETEEV